MKNKLETWTFSVSPMGDSWLPCGVSSEREELWCGGCCVKDKRVAQMIALNMEVAFIEGWKSAMKHIQQSIMIPLPVKEHGWETDHDE